MSDEFFFDTNIIAYAFDEFDMKKRSACKDLVDKAFKGEITGYVSNQVLGELFIVLTQKMGKPITRKVASIIVESVIDSERWIKVNYDHETIKKAITASKMFKVRFWDAVIAETMVENGILKIFTENEKDFKRIPNIKVINPLR